MTPLDECLAVAAVGVTAVAAVTDHRTGHIPNALTLPALFGAPLSWAVLDYVRRGDPAHAGRAFAASVGGAFVCGLFPAYQFSRRQLGGGDLKLFAALGALLGPVVGLQAQFFAMLFAALWIPATWAWRGELWSTVVRGLKSLRRPRATAQMPPKRTVRIGPAIFAGALCALALRGTW